jgi:multidrug resistance protein, MATE family
VERKLIAPLRGDPGGAWRYVVPPVSPRHTLRQEIASLARLALPLATASAGQATMGLVDAAVCGRAGAVVLAGTGLGNALFFAVAVFGMGVMMGLDPLVAQAFGAGEPRVARRLLWQGTWLALAAGLLLSAPLAFAPLALEPLGIEPDVARQASGYLWVRLPGLPALLFFVAARSYLQGVGLTRAVVLATVVANVLNLLLDLLLVFGGAGLPAWTGPLRSVPALGAAGSALATALVTYVQGAVLAIAIAGVPIAAAGAPGARGAPPRGARAWSKLRRPVRAELARAVRVGLPVGLHMGAEVGIFALVGFLAGRLGPAPLAAHQIGIALASTTFTFAVGIGNAATVRVGWAVGARDTPAARRAGLTAFSAGAVVMSLSAMAFFLFPRGLARLMTDDAAVVAAAVPLLRVAAAFQIADGVQGVGAGVLRGAGDTRYTFTANMLGHWVFGFPLALGLGVFGSLGVTGLWWGLAGGLSAVAVALLLRFLWLSAREIAPLVERAPRVAEG